MSEDEIMDARRKFAEAVRNGFTMGRPPPFGSPTISDWFAGRGIDDPDIVCAVIAALAANDARIAELEAALNAVVDYFDEQGFGYVRNEDGSVSDPPLHALIKRINGAIGLGPAKTHTEGGQ